MKKLFAAVIVLSFFSCQQDFDGYSITGSIDNVEDGKIIYISKLDPNNEPERIDSVAVKNEKFALDLPNVDQPYLGFLTFQGIPGNVMFIAENETIHFNIYRDSIPASSVSGGRENEAFQSYISHLKDLNRQAMEIRNTLQQEMAGGNATPETMSQFREKEEGLRKEDMEFKKEMVRQNPDKFVSVLIVTDMQSMGASNQEIREHYELLSQDLKETPFGQTLRESIDKRGAVEIGSKAPEFSGPNPAGEEISLNEAMGKVTLIDFWAAWCRPCRVENPNIVRVYNEYHDRGFNVIGVSLDREDQRDRWLQAIEEDNLTWTQISHLQFWEEPIAQLYGVKAIPAAFILDENGVIVAKNLRGEDLENKVRELLEE